MKSLFLTIQKLAFWLLPCIGLNIYLSATYNESIYGLSLWWFDNASFSVTELIKLLAFVILFLLFSIQLTSLINSLFLAVYGHRHSYVFLGNLAKSTAIKYRAKDKKKNIFSVPNPEHEFNYSFNDVNRLQTFIELPFVERTLINSRQHFHPYSILSRIMLMLFFAMPTLAAVHALALPAYVPEQSRGVILSDNGLLSFDQVLSIYSLNLFTIAVVFFFSLMLAIYFSSKQQQGDLGKQVEPLPENICAKGIVTGKPLIIVKTTVEKFDEVSQLKTRVDTGFRRVSFEFTQGFSHPVYVTLKYDGRKYSELEGLIKSNIKFRRCMTLMLTDKLRLKVIEESVASLDKAA